MMTGIVNTILSNTILSNIDLYFAGGGVCSRWSIATEELELFPALDLTNKVICCEAAPHHEWNMSALERLIAEDPTSA